VLLRLALAWSVAFGALLLVARALVPNVETGLAVALFFVAQELGTTLLVVTAARAATSPAREGALPSVSVLVAALDEVESIEHTIASALAQRGVTLEVIVADDGSTDGTADLVERRFGERVRVLRLPHRGKGAALEAARAVARHPVLVTIDADTELDEGALAALAAAFVDPRVEAAAGAVIPRLPRGWLERFQVTEYLKNTLMRRGWSALGALDQVPGALAAIRASSLAHAGGFPTDSLTEDYEVAFRLYRVAANEGRRIAIPTIAEARAYTEPPRTLGGLVRQRTRWFAGFLSTLWRFRGEILRPRARTFGLVRLPLKVLDAVLPPLGLFSLGAMVVGIARGAPMVSALSLTLLVVRGLADALVHASAIDLHARTLPAHRTLARAPLWITALAESWTYAWLKQLAVLRAYPFALARVRTWERAREPVVARGMAQSEVEAIDPAE
jgi:cellulose synthase/poly-beta-1,6-N-acetylglucosamine synthase-like glycosyltransferase